MTDREIGVRLFISVRTAQTHVEQILARLGFRSRSQIAGWVSRRPVTSPADATDPLGPRRG